MKTLSIGVAILVSALVIGCQDSNFNNPISSDAPKPASSLAKNFSSNPDGILDLKTPVVYRVSDLYQLTYLMTGGVQYTLTPTGDQEIYTLSLVTRVELQSLNEEGEVGIVYSEIIEPVKIVGKDAFTFEQAYLVSKLSQELELHMTFSVSPEDVHMTKVWLERPPSVQIAATK